MDMLGFDPNWEDGVSFDFGFDKRAGTDIGLAMANELPYTLAEMEGRGVPTVMDFLAGVANQTAATREQIEKTISLLHGEKQIELLNASGTPRRRNSKPAPTDIIRISRQLVMPGMAIPRPGANHGGG